MSRTTNDKAKQAARVLYEQGWTQREIAASLGYNERSVGEWARAEGWRSRLMDIRDFDHYCLDSVRGHLRELFASIQNNEEGKRYPDSKQADVIGKLRAIYHEFARELSVGQLVGGVNEFAKWMKKNHLDMAKQLVPYFDDYLKHVTRDEATEE